MNKSELKEVLRQIGQLATRATRDSKETSTKGETYPDHCDDDTATAPDKQGFDTADLRPADGVEGTSEAAATPDSDQHIYSAGTVCATDSRGQPEPDDRSPDQLVVDASNGFIPLWVRGSTLIWKFNEASMRYFSNPAAAKRALRVLLGRGIGAWGDASPVRFKERRSDGDPWDFEVYMRWSDDCNPRGCVLASAFFPESGRNRLVIYPRMLRQDVGEIVETLAHEVGHIFGLRHFFADVSETSFPSEVFGTHSRFSVMNYGRDSRMTETDRSDLRNLYRQVWSGQLTQINGTRIRLFRPYSVSGVSIFG